MLTPVRRQYQELKKRYPDAILFFQLGDFYETFEADAETVARICEITLTSREMGFGGRLPLAGVPVHAAEGYIAKLIRAGFRVAICQQVERNARPSFTKIMAGEGSAGSRAPIAREVTRVVTPGTVVEPGLLDEKANNYLAAVVAEGSRAGLAYADITTGEFACTQIAAAASKSGPNHEDVWAVISAELGRLRPAESLVPRGDGRHAPDGEPATHLNGFTLTPLDARHFQLDPCRDALREQLGASSLEAFGCAGLPLAIRAAGALVLYLRETQRVALEQMISLRTYSPGSFMALDAATRRNLELELTSRGGSVKGSLLSVLDCTGTAMGGRLLRSWLSQPLLDLPRLLARQEAVAEFLADTLLRARLVGLLKKVGDMERVTSRVAQGIAGPRDLLGLKASIETATTIKWALRESFASQWGTTGEDLAVFERRARLLREGEGAVATAAPRRATLWAQMDECHDVAELIAQAIAPDAPASLADGGVIAAGFAPDLDALRDGSQEARRYIAGLEATERERTGLKSLKVGYNKVFGYYIEVTHPALRAEVSEAQLARARQGLPASTPAGGQPKPPTMHDFLEQYCGYIRKQTLVGAERYITPELKEKEALVLSAQERIVEVERRVFREVCLQVAAARQRLLATANALAHLDVFVSLAEVATLHNYVRPGLNDGGEIRISGGRHPVVETVLDPGDFVPNDCHLSGNDQQLIVLTGPNMAGKSTFLRQVAVIVLMAQIGSYVPAESASIGLVDRIFTRVGAQDDIATGQSTFMVEMAETAHILGHATPRSLVVFDEIGRGTSTFDGMAIARAVIEHVHNSPRLGCKTLFATHYHELTALEGILPRVKNYRMDVLEEGAQVVFLHKVVRGGADRSYGIYVARLAGIPKAVTRRAEELLRELEEGRGSALQGGRNAGRGVPDGVLQLGLFLDPHPLIDDLRQIDVDSLTPLEAIAKLYELKKKAQESEG